MLLQILAEQKNSQNFTEQKLAKFHQGNFYAVVRKK